MLATRKRKIPRCFIYTALAIMAILAVSWASWSELLLVPVLIFHSAALLLDRDAFDFSGLF